MLSKGKDEGVGNRVWGGENTDRQTTDSTGREGATGETLKWSWYFGAWGLKKIVSEVCLQVM